MHAANADSVLFFCLEFLSPENHSLMLRMEPHEQPKDHREITEDGTT